ncbi:MAG: tetratricopeptide repeat protein, partial [Gemmatimonadetes bacterium]|nr:tetratricopeptide repeat protein [Gemmatimonadota bacterium]
MPDPASRDASAEAEIANLTGKLSRNPTSRLFAPLAEALRRAGRVSEAIDVASRGLGHHPDYLAGKLVLARAHYDSGELARAAPAFEEVVQVDPHNVVALRALGEVALERG